jgi:hypothetical protein
MSRTTRQSGEQRPSGPYRPGNAELMQLKRELVAAHERHEAGNLARVLAAHPRHVAELTEFVAALAATSGYEAE